MDRFLNFNLLTLRCKDSILCLACAWIFGLISGVLFSMSASGVLVPTMRAAIHSRVSIFGLLSAMLLPLLFSALAVYISRPRLLIPVAFFKAFLFAYLGIGLLDGFGSAGWLVCVLLMFSDILMLPLLWWLWIQMLMKENKPVWNCFAVVFPVAALIGSLDYCVISPFLANIIS